MLHIRFELISLQSFYPKFSSVEILAFQIRANQILFLIPEHPLVSVGLNRLSSSFSTLWKSSFLPSVLKAHSIIIKTEFQINFNYNLRLAEGKAHRVFDEKQLYPILTRFSYSFEIYLANHCVYGISMIPRDSLLHIQTILDVKCIWTLVDYHYPPRAK